MENKVTEKVFEYIDALAQKLGVAAEYVFALIVRQKTVEGIVYGSVLIVASIVVWIFAYKVIKYTTTNWDEIEDNDLEGGFMIVSIILVFVAIILFVVNIIELPGYILQIYNPEYYAIKEILDTLK